MLWWQFVPTQDVGAPWQAKTKPLVIDQEPLDSVQVLIADSADSKDIESALDVGEKSNLEPMDGLALVSDTSVNAVSRKPVGYAAHHQAVESLSKAEISNAVDAITGSKPVSIKNRFAALELLRFKALPKEQSDRLLDYLADSERIKGMSNSAMHMFINELVAVFHDSPNLDSRYLSVSRDVINNEQEDEVIRDYTLQGLSRGYENATDQQAAYIKQTLWENVKRTDSSLAGTSLLALNRVSRVGDLSTEDRSRLESIVAQNIADPVVGERTRISSMQVASALGMKGVVSELANIASSEEATISERIAAEGAIEVLAQRSF